jgi:hypothetical protein
MIPVFSKKLVSLLHIFESRPNIPTGTVTARPMTLSTFSQIETAYSY